MNSRLRKLLLPLLALMAVVAIGLPLFVHNPASAATPSAKPNIIFIMADDLGNADVGYHGSEIRTPNIDKLAQTGAKLESFYGMHVCTPSRAALMTGRYPMRLGLQTLVIFPNHKYGVPLDERMLPQALKAAGYDTAIVGKWHLGHADRAFWPQNRGFDYFFGNVVGEVDYFTKERGGLIDFQRNGTFLGDSEPGYYTTQIGDEAVKLIEKQDPSKPFFLYTAFLAVHAPYQAPQKYIDQYANIQDPQRRTYAAMLTSMDDEIGKIVNALEKKGMRDNTLIVFSSDNGGPASGLFATGARSPEERAAEGVTTSATPPPRNTPYRNGKGTLYEGGVRVVSFMNWPGQIKPGTVVNQPIHMVDVFPTLVKLAGGTVEGSKPLDGKDIWATVTQGAASPNEDILINAEIFRGGVRKGDWKLIKQYTLPPKTELYNLATDVSEKTNVADQNPAIVSDLEARLLKYGSEQKPSEWLKAQVNYLGVQGETATPADLDAGTPGAETAMPGS